MKINNDRTIFNDKFNKLCNLAKKHNNFNAYGWLMRYMQFEEDFYILEKERKMLISHIERIEKELENQENGK